jgi:hypothetical protein
MSRPIPVTPERWGEMVKAMAENTRLKADNERLSEIVQTAHADLFSENASLKAEVERLKKPAIIGGYNISEYIRMANSETLEFDNGDIFADMTLPERIKYIVESHARLKEEVKVWKDVGTDNGVACNERAKENQHLENKIARLIQAGELVAEWVQDHIKGQVGCLDPADLTRAWEEAKRYVQHE